MMNYGKFIMVIFLLFWRPLDLLSQKDTSSISIIHNPKIGLVLSGGGALGLAHIGVIKVLEEKGIKPDYIVGTSMGSIVGGLYALGYTADEIEAFILATNWDKIMSRNIPLNYVANEEKYDYGRYMINFPFKNNKPQLPSGLIEGQLLTEDLISHTWSAVNYSSFDEFPIPFRCVGTNVSNGDEIIFKDGSLALSMRASMAIPTVFTPVNLDSTLIVDGGVVNNFPVDVALEMGAEYIIGSDVTSGYHEAYDIDNMVSILYQISMFPSLDKMESNIKKTDIYVHPDVSEFSASDFNKAKAIIESGEQTARLQLPELDSFLNSTNYHPQQIARQVAPYSDSIFVSNVRFHSLKKQKDLHLIEKLEREPNTIVDIEEYKKDTRLLYGSLKFKSISYWATPDTALPTDTINSVPSYLLDVHVEEHSNTDIKVGVHYDNTFGFGVVANLTTYNQLIDNTRFKLQVDFSENFKVDVQWLKYLGHKKNFSFIANYKFFALEQPTYEKGQLASFQQNNISLFDARFQTHHKLNRNLSFGYQYLFDGTTVKLGDENFKNFKTGNGYHIVFAEYRHNTLNRNYHPTKGAQVFIRTDLNLTNKLQIKYPNNVTEIPVIGDGDTILLTEDEFNHILKNSFIPKNLYASVVGKYTQHIKLTNKLNLVANLDAALTIGQENENQLYRGFNVGGNVNLFYYDLRAYGLRYAEDLTNNVGIIRADLQYSPISKIILYGGANMAFFSNSGFRLNSFASDLKTFTSNELFGYGFNAAYLSPFGPIEVGASWNSNDPYTRWNILIGFQF